MDEDGSLEIQACEQTNNQAANCEESPERLALLKDSILALKPRYQTIITLRFFESLKLTEIADILAVVRAQFAAS